MALITLRQLLDHAAEHGYGVPAFNINNMEQGLAILKAAAAVDAPVILQASRGARSYAGDIMLRRMVEAGYGKRIMYGSDQMVWPQTISVAIVAITEADYLTEAQKRDILYNNAARFLRLTPAQIAAHHKR